MLRKLDKNVIVIQGFNRVAYNLTASLNFTLQSLAKSSKLRFKLPTTSQKKVISINIIAHQQEEEELERVSLTRGSNYNDEQ